MNYIVELWLPEETGAQQRLRAEQRFAHALEESLGEASLVLPTYQAYAQIVQIYGQAPNVEQMTDAERHVYESWSIAETAALRSAFGEHRHMGEGLYEIKPSI